MENITLLIGMMKTLGFEDGLGYKLAKKASFHPENFVITQVCRRNGDVIRYDVCFQRKAGIYHLRYYDASLRKAIELPETLTELDKHMGEIDWNEAFNMTAPANFDENAAMSWKPFAEVAQIVSDLEAVGDQESVIRLKVKHWADVSQDMFNLSVMRSKFEITQRFYFFEDNGCISIENAYQFLQNRWMEKQMLVKRKTESNAEHSDENSNTKLLPKKRGGGKRKALL